MRKKQVYKLNIPEALESIGCPSEFVGIRSVKKSLGKFIDDKLDALIGIYHPNDEEMDEAGRVVDYVTWRERCKKEALGYKYVYKNKDDQIGVFEKDSYMTEEVERRVDRFSRAMNDEVTNRDFLGYVPSYYSKKLTVVGNAIIRSERDRAIRKGYYFSIIKKVQGPNTLKEMIDYGIRQNIIHKVLDDIIYAHNTLDYEVGDNIWEGKKEDAASLMRDLEDGSIDKEEYFEEMFDLDRVYFDKLFRGRRSNSELAAFVDTKREDNWKEIDVRKADKIIRVMEALKHIGEEKKETAYDKKRKLVEKYFNENPNSNTSECAKELGMSRNTVAKYRKEGCSKFAPNTSNIGSIYTAERTNFEQAKPPYLEDAKLPDNREDTLKVDLPRWELMQSLIEEETQKK